MTMKVKFSWASAARNAISRTTQMPNPASITRRGPKASARAPESQAATATTNP
nr:hypothetical protein [Streptomyces hygroscopicus]